jgi:hypothetical protein
VAGPLGFEPRILGSGEFYDFCHKRYYSKVCAQHMYSLALKHQRCYEDLSQLPVIDRKNIVKALICYSKWRGEYVVFAGRLKAFNFKWTKQSAIQSFLKIINRPHESLPDYIKDVNKFLLPNEQLFTEFLAVTGLRVGEAVMAFNKLIETGGEGYYNPELSCLEHYRHSKFLRTTKNAFLSFISPELFDRVTKAKPISITALTQRIERNGLKTRLKDLRSFNNTFLRQKGGIESEIVDLLAGRVPESVFVRHYYGVNLQLLSKQILAIGSNLLESLYQ